VSVNVILDGQGELKGKIQYFHAPRSLSMHADVECSGISTDGTVAVAVGPAKVQSDPTHFMDPYPWFGVAVREGGTGSGDRVRVPVFTNEASALVFCGQADTLVNTTWGVEVIDGNYTIRN